MKIARYLLTLALTLLCIALAVEFGLRAYMPDAYRGYLIPVGNDQVKWRIGPFEPTQSAVGFNPPIQLSKPEDTLRIVALGTSATEGWLTAVTVYKKYSREPRSNGLSSYSRAMEFILNDISEPGSKKIEVINLGVAAYNISDVIRMLKDSMQLDPDLLLIQIGGNETWTAERYDWASYINKNIPYLYLETAFEFLSETKGGWSTLSRGGDAFNPLALFSSGPEPVVVEPPGRAAGLEERLETYRSELDRLGEFLDDQDVPFLFQVPSPNLADYEPFGSMAKVGTTKEQLAELNALLKEALVDRSPASKQKYLDILALDDGIAEANFQLGRIYLEEQRPDEARELFWKAANRDLVLKRLPGTFRDISMEFVQKNNFPYIDEMKLFEEGTESGVLGYNRLDDDVHPNLEAQFDLAAGLAEITVLSNNLPTDSYNANLEQIPEFEDYVSHIGFDQLAIGNLAYLKAAHNYLTFGRFRNRLNWEPRPELLLQSTLDELTIANKYAPSDSSLVLTTMLNLYLGRENEAAEAIAALDCGSSEQRAQRVNGTVSNATRTILGNQGPEFREKLVGILVAEGCRQ